MALVMKLRLIKFNQHSHLDPFMSFHSCICINDTETDKDAFNMCDVYIKRLIAPAYHWRIPDNTIKMRVCSTITLVAFRFPLHKNVICLCLNVSCFTCYSCHFMHYSL